MTAPSSRRRRPLLSRATSSFAAGALSILGLLLVLGVRRAGAVNAATRGAEPAPTSAAAPLGYDVRDDDTSAPIPCKLVFVGSTVGSGSGTAVTPSPSFTVDDVGLFMGDAIAAHDRVMSASGQGSLALPAGTYDVYVSRGPEWSLSIHRGVVVSSRPSQITTRLRHVVDTDGWVSADFHVHASASSDSRVPMIDRVYEFLADGVDVITSTDHNAVADYAPDIDALGVSSSIRSIVGDELTTERWGHFGLFPVPAGFPAAALLDDGSAAAMFADARRRAPGAIIDVHHPRLQSEIGYFDVGELDAAADRARPGFSTDFDAVEVLNGYQDANRSSIDRVLTDWFELLRHGHLVTATGNSDTHHLDHNVGGYPRNYVRVADDRPSVVTPGEIARSLRAHHSFFTTAPFVRLRAGGAGIGDVVEAQGGLVDLDVEVDAAPWVSVSRVVLYLSGREYARYDVPDGDAVERFRKRVRLRVDEDAFVVVRVEGDRPLAPVVGNRTDFDVWPMAVTNPLFIDRDGNGAYDPPPP